MGSFRRFMFWLLRAKHGAGIAVGSWMTTTGKQDVMLFMHNGWRRHGDGVQLSPAGARRVARQLNEWADASDQHNAMVEKEKSIQKWTCIIDTAIKSETEGEANADHGVEHNGMPR